MTTDTADKVPGSMPAEAVEGAESILRQGPAPRVIPRAEDLPLHLRNALAADAEDFFTAAYDRGIRRPKA